jgi:cytochrome d ubiquinol oxidase subunit II
MFVATGAYIAAVFLVRDARAAGEEDVQAHFRRCAIGIAVVAGALAVAGVFALRADARFVYDGLTGPGLPLVILSASAVPARWAARARRGRPAEALAYAARRWSCGAVIPGWGVAQYLYPPLTGPHDRQRPRLASLVR